MIGAFATDEARPLARPADAVVAQRRLERGVDGFRPRIDEEDMLQADRQQLGETFRQAERGTVAVLHGRGIVETTKLPVNRVSDLLCARGQPAYNRVRMRRRGPFATPSVQ